MGTILTIASQKGGVGKTTTALNLGYSLSRLGGSVLVVDGDPQASLGIASNLKQRTKLGLFDVLVGRATPAELVTPTRHAPLAFVGMGSVGPAELPALEEAARDGRLGALVRALATGHDHTLIDAPAGAGAITMALLAASASVILPVQPRALSLKTISAFLKVIHFTRRTENPALSLAGVLVTMFDAARRADVAAIEEVRATFPPEVMFRTTIPLDDTLEPASLRAVPAWFLPEAERAARSYMDLALELKARALEGELSDGAAASLF
ncbi:MAG: ParA family protein [Polyangiaceae bacterium]|nr:ParA family protein [Polyangiaceae bacterium]